jgi:DNA-directed RNA polymerase specialized sigma24 family protein
MTSRRIASSDPATKALHEVPLVELARRCREETQRFLRGEPRDDGFCFEVFQRAVAGRDDAAWEAIMAQYRGIILAYIGQHSVASSMHESDDYWVNRAFQRFWSAVGPERFGQFADLASLLKYLKLCVHSVLMDEVRTRKTASFTSLDDTSETTPASANSERSAIGRLAGEQLWETVMRELEDEGERMVAYLSFARDLKPSEIYGRYPRLYESVADVYRIKRNVVDRLRRSPDVRSFLGA